MSRKIIHIDCDCYYAALEMRDFPALRGRPVAVGGQGPRSVLSTCNYEARRYGLHSAMPSRRALSLCPGLIIQPHRFDVYREVSEQIRQIFTRYTDRIEPLSLDEAFLDVSDSTWFGGSASMLAEHIRQEIVQETGITVSAGIAPNKFLAKIASEWQKPNGLYSISPSAVDEFLKGLPLKKINGVGSKFSQKLAEHGLHTCGDVLKWSLPRLTQYFGKSGLWLYQRARGIDHRPVGVRSHRKSLSVEHTFDTDLAGEAACLTQLTPLLDTLNRRLAAKDPTPIKGVFVKVRFNDFSTTTMERGLPCLRASYEQLLKAACQKSHRGVRLLGLGVRFEVKQSDDQLELWPVVPAQDNTAGLEAALLSH